MAALPTLCTAFILSPAGQRDDPELWEGIAGRQKYAGQLRALGV
jgi:hypothetical protein